MDLIRAFMIEHNFIAIFISLIFGGIIGSFLNMFNYRYPIMLEQAWQETSRQATKKETFNLCFPASHCPQCKHAITWWMNIPILSFIFLLGRCYYCKKAIGIHYFLTEILCALATLVVYIHSGFTAQTITLLAFTYGLISLSIIDFYHQILPDTLVYILLWLGLLASTQSLFIAPTQAIYGAIIGYLFLWVIAQLYALLRKKDGMGLGDCKMLGMLGAWVGVTPLMSIILISAILALLVSLFLLAKKRISRQELIPFGPFLAVAGWLVVMQGDFVSHWISLWLM